MAYTLESFVSDLDRITRSPRFNVTSMVWRPGDRAGAHNHETWDVIGIIDNEIEETRYRVTETGAGGARLEPLRVMRHGPGAVSRLVPGDEVHAMHNPTDSDTVEIHVYGRDLFGLPRRTWAEDSSEKPLVSAKYFNCWEVSPAALAVEAPSPTGPDTDGRSRPG